MARVRLTIVWLCCWACAFPAQAQQVGLSARPDLSALKDVPVSRSWVESPVIYSRCMLVCATADGVAALRFVEPFSLANETGNGVIGVTCEWRFRPVVQTEELAQTEEQAESASSEQRGHVRLFAKLKDGVRQKGNSEIRCGSILLEWRSADQQSGFVACDPAQHQLQAISLDWFDERVLPLGRDGRRPPLDLARFFLPTEQPLEQAAPPNTEQLASFVSYAETVTMIYGPAGVTEVEFGEAFERSVAANQRHHGVTYRYRHFSPEGRVEEGTGEVFELYRDNGYNSAGSQLILRTGPMQLTWSVGGSPGGWLYYDPSQVRVWTCRAEQRQNLLTALRSGPLVRPVPPSAAAASATSP